MKKIWWIILAIIVVIILLFVGKYNSMVNLDESVKTSRSQVENVYQRRLDLIPNLVQTVKGIANQEQAVFIGVTEARALATKVNININDAKEFSQFQKSQGELSSALTKLMAVAENYPDIKSNQNFLALQTQLEGTENRIAVERKNFNEKVKEYNIYLRVFPNNILASIFGFIKANLFEATEGADQPPVVNFNN
ncbi:MAG: LemA family protein [Candidatus Absconditabacterales bacterium]